MPIYEYICEKCQHQFELIQKFSDTPITECPECKGSVRKIISSPGIMFKGAGWYVTDYSDKMKKPGSGSDKSKPSDKEASGKETSGKDSHGKESSGKDHSGATPQESPKKEKPPDSGGPAAPPVSKPSENKK